jgi:hypothetical protein
MEELVAGWWEYARLPQWSRDERKRLETGDECSTPGGTDSTRGSVAGAKTVSR